MMGNIRELIRKQNKTWLTKVVRQMVDYAKEPDRWWTYTSDAGPFLDKRRSPMDYTYSQDGVTLLVRVDFRADFDDPQSVLVVKVALEEEIIRDRKELCSMLDEIKRAAFGANDPGIKMLDGDEDPAIIFARAIPLPPNFIMVPEIGNKQCLALN